MEVTYRGNITSRNFSFYPDLIDMATVPTILSTVGRCSVPRFPFARYHICEQESGAATLEGTTGTAQRLAGSIPLYSSMARSLQIQNPNLDMSTFCGFRFHFIYERRLPPLLLPDIGAGVWSTSTEATFTVTRVQ